MATSTRRPAAATATPTLSPADVEKALALARHSKSVELKLTVPMAGHRDAAARIGIDAVEAQPCQIFFFDTPDLALNRAGLIVRARRRAGGRADTAIKLRPVDPSGIEAELKRSDSFKIEVDATAGGTFTCSATYKGAATNQEVRDAADGKMPLRDLFSREQLAFFDAHVPAGIAMNQLVVQGPIYALRLKHQPKSFRYPLILELWLWDDGHHLLEISTKCPPAEAFQAAAEFKGFLATKGISLESPQEAKTRTAMQRFKAAAPPRSRKAVAPAGPRKAAAPARARKTPAPARRRKAATPARVAA